MQAGYGKVIARNVLNGLGSPLTGLKLIWRRLFTFGIVPRDREAYRIGSWSYGRAARVPIADIFPGIQHVEVRVLNTYARDVTTSVESGRDHRAVRHHPVPGVAMTSSRSGHSTATRRSTWRAMRVRTAA
jgi:hypothetical protein